MESVTDAVSTLCLKKPTLSRKPTVLQLFAHMYNFTMHCACDIFFFLNTTVNALLR